MRKRQFLFRLFYSTSFTILLIIEILLLLISPGDIIYQSSAAGRTLSIVAVAIVYVAVFLVSAFIIATRFYTAHTQLTSIPKSHIPIRKNDLSKSLRKLIISELSRSASIAYHAHPRPVRPADIDALARENSQARSKSITWSLEHMRGWREMDHPGWSSPCATTLPDLQFEPVVLEFPHLIEAKAVSMAPPDLTSDANESGLEDVALPRAVQILQRPASMSLRQYVNRLKDLGMLDREDITDRFVNTYEAARFSSTQIKDTEFRNMLELFTEIIQDLTPPSGSALEAFYAQSPGLSTASSLSALRSKAPSKPATKLSTSENAASTASHPDYNQRGSDGDQPTPKSQSHTPFLTPRPYIYPPSLSSGHAGDRSSESSESENDSSFRTSKYRSGRHTRTGNSSRYASVATSAKKPAGLLSADPTVSQHDTESDNNGSVIRRRASVQSHQSNLSNASYRSKASYETSDSVIHRPDERESALPALVARGSGHDQGLLI